MENISRKSVCRGPPPPYTENEIAGSAISVTIISGLAQLPPPYSDIGSSIVLQPVSSLYTEVPFVVRPPDTSRYNSSLGQEPLSIVCPMCLQTIETKIRYEPNRLTHVMALIICCLGGFCCMFMPYCIHSCQDLKHYCPNPNCGAFIGTFSI